MAQIKISANTTSFRKSIIELANYTKKGFGGSAVSLFDKNTIKLLSGDADKVLGKLENRSTKLKGLIREYSQKVKESANDSKREVEYKEKLVRATQRLMAIERERKSLGEGSRALRGGVMGQFGGGFKDAAKNIPGIGGLFDLGTMGAVGLAAGGALLGAGMYGYSRLSAGYDKYHAGIGSRLKLMGRGVHDTDMNPGMRRPFAETGMDEEAVRQARLQSMDIFGSKGSTQGAVLGRAQFARNYGVDLQTLQGYGSGFRAQTSTAGASRDMMKLQASLQASEIKDAIGPYLDTAASMLTDIRQSGLVNSSEVLGLLSAVTRRTGNAPEQIAGEFSGMQHAVQGSSGENNAFFQTAFSRAGIGGKTIGGVQAAIQSGGIFGVNPEDLKGMSPQNLKMLQGMGIIEGKNGRGGVKDRLSSIMGLADSQFNTTTPEGKLAQARFMQPKLGAKNAVQSMKMMDEIRGALKSGDMDKMKQAEDNLRKAGASPQERMLDNLDHMTKSQEGQIEILDAIRSDQLEYMGKEVAPAAMLASKTLLHIDELIAGIYNGLASWIPGMKSESQKMTGAMRGDQAMTQAQVSEIDARGGQQGVLSAAGTIGANSYDVQQELSATKKRRERDSQYNTGMVGEDDNRIKMLTEQLKNLNEAQQKLIDAAREHIRVSKSIEASTKKGVKNQSKPKPEVDASADSTTGQ